MRTDFEYHKKLSKEEQTKTVMLVMDGLGGTGGTDDDRTELEAAHTPNLDSLAGEGICGLHEPVSAGTTPGSGPSHLALFGYDPLEYSVGRGVLSALGIGFDLQAGDVAARGNFCTVDEQGVITDRRAGRISTEKNKELCERLNTITIPGVQVIVRPVKEHRFLFVLRGENLSGEIQDTDPQQTGRPPSPPRAQAPSSAGAANFVGEFVNKASEILKDTHPANMIILRGFSRRPDWPSLKSVHGINAAAIAGYPMYKGVAKLVGMKPLETESATSAELQCLSKYWNDFDFFFMHIKGTDSAGEDGDRDRKISVIEEVDKIIPHIRELNPDVLAVTGDHSTPSALKSHSWHPVPVVLWSRHCRPDRCTSFGERPCLAGSLGPRFPAHQLMPLMMANGMRRIKYGA